MPVREVLATKLGSSIRRVCAGRGGAGDLCTRLVKCHFFEKIPAYRSPRFWVDLIQRQTGKIRWHPSHCLSEPETGMACLTTSWPLLAVSIAHRPGAVVIETIVLEDKYRVNLTTPDVQIPGDLHDQQRSSAKKGPLNLGTRSTRNPTQQLQ